MNNLATYKNNQKADLLNFTSDERTKIPNFVMPEPVVKLKKIISATGQEFQITFPDQKMNQETLAETIEFFKESLRLTYPQLSALEIEEIASLSITEHSFHPKNDTKFIILRQNSSQIFGLASFKLINSCLYINQIYLDKNLKGQGLGSKILQQILNNNPKAEIIELNVSENNKEAIAFYKMLGFVSSSENVGSLNPKSENQIKLISMKVDRLTLFSKITSKLSKK